MRSFSRVLALGALTVSISASSLALAGDTSTAEHLFLQGLEAMKKNQFKEACDAFAGSNEADPSPGTEINLALCNEKQAKLASAWGWYRTAAGLAEQRGQKDRADLARREAAKLEPKLHKLVITVKVPAEGLTVTRDGAPVPSAVLGTDVPMDPGDYVIEVTAKGKKPWKQTVHIASGPGTERLEIPALDDAPVDAAKGGGGAGGGAGAAASGGDYRPPQNGNDGSTQRTIAFVLGGAGILALLAAGGIQLFNLAVTNPDYKQVKKDYDGHQPNPCTPADELVPGDCQQLGKGLKSKDDARSSNQLAAAVVGAGGAALLITGIVLLVTAPSSKSAASLTTKPRLLPVVGRDMTGFGLSGAF
jgi:hypothetical protein